MSHVTHEWVMSRTTHRTWTCTCVHRHRHAYVYHMNFACVRVHESCHTHKWVMSHTNEAYLPPLTALGPSHVYNVTGKKLCRVNESCHSREWVVPHMNESCHTRMRHIFRHSRHLDLHMCTMSQGKKKSCGVNESCQTREWVVSHMKESCHTRMRHVTHMNESCNTWMSQVTHEWVISPTN